MSPSVTRITGYTPEEHYADPELGRRILHPEDVSELARLALTPDEQQLYTLPWMARDGAVFVTEHRVRRALTDDGALVAIVEVRHSALAAMVAAGFYETSGRWFYDTGLPGKSGIAAVSSPSRRARAAWARSRRFSTRRTAA